MWGLVAVVVGVFVTAIVFAVYAGLRSSGVGPSGYAEIAQAPVENRGYNNGRGEVG
jgi:hypothetical protein